MDGLLGYGDSLVEAKSIGILISGTQGAQRGAFSTTKFIIVPLEKDQAKISQSGSISSSLTHTYSYSSSSKLRLHISSEPVLAEALRAEEV